MAREENNRFWLRKQINKHITEYNESKTDFNADFLHGYISAARMADAISHDEDARIFDALLNRRNCPYLMEEDAR